MGPLDMLYRVCAPLLARRQHRRGRAALPVDWRVFGSGVGHRSSTKDLSRCGAMVATASKAPVGSPLVIGLTTPQGELSVHARVAWSSETRMGIRFTRPLPSFAL
jgi:hypothetical protein